MTCNKQITIEMDKFSPNDRMSYVWETSTAMLKPFGESLIHVVKVRAALHLEAGPIRCVRGLKSSLVISQKGQIGPNPFTPRRRADLVWFDSFN
jgi:hypothetical protein